VTLDNLSRWLSLLANIGVLLGIVFLVIEIDQNSLETKLQTETSFLSSFTDVELSTASNPELIEALLKSQKGAPLDEADQLRTLLFYRAVLRSYQNTYYQAQTGVLNQDIWRGEQAQMRQSFGFDKGLASFWRANNSMYTEEFNDLVRAMLVSDDA